MADKYLKQNGAFLQEVIAEDGTTPSNGEIVALDTAGKIAVNILPVGYAPDTDSIEASENISAGDFVNIWNDAGTPKVRKADSTDNTKPADGFVKSAYTTGQMALVYFETKNDQLTGLTPGQKLFLGTSGNVTSTAPSAPGNIVQVVGFAIGATVATVEIQRPIIVA